MRDFNIGDRFNIRKAFADEPTPDCFKDLKPPSGIPWPDGGRYDDGGGGDDPEVIDAEFRDVTDQTEPFALPPAPHILPEATGAMRLIKRRLYDEVTQHP